MRKETQEKLAGSLTAQTTELLPFLPYLLQDFWELGINPGAIIQLVHRHVSLSDRTRILDLACGKGAVSIQLAERFHVPVKGIDLLPEFIRYASKKAQELHVDAWCEFTVGDIGQAVTMEKDYDCVMFGAVGDVLGNFTETLHALKATVKQGGHLLLDNYDFIPQKQWTALFEGAGLELIEAFWDDCGVNDHPGGSFRLISDSGLGMAALTKRANELIQKHPGQKSMFEGYLASQQKEYDDIGAQDSQCNATWILKKK